MPALTALTGYLGCTLLTNLSAIRSASGAGFVVADADAIFCAGALATITGAGAPATTTGAGSTAFASGTLIGVVAGTCEFVITASFLATSALFSGGRFASNNCLSLSSFCSLASFSACAICVAVFVEAWSIHCVTSATLLWLTGFLTKPVGGVVGTCGLSMEAVCFASSVGGFLEQAVRIRPVQTMLNRDP